MVLNVYEWFKDLISKELSLITVATSNTLTPAMPVYRTGNLHESKK